MEKGFAPRKCASNEGDARDENKQEGKKSPDVRKWESGGWRREGALTPVCLLQGIYRENCSKHEVGKSARREWQKKKRKRRVKD